MYLSSTETSANPGRLLMSGLADALGCIRLFQRAFPPTTAWGGYKSISGRLSPKVPSLTDAIDLAGVTTGVFRNPQKGVRICRRLVRPVCEAATNPTAQW